MGRRRRDPVDTAHIDPKGLWGRMFQFVEWMQAQNYSERTIDSRRPHLADFNRWCEERGITRPDEVTRPILERYQRHLYLYRTKAGKPLTFRSQNNKLVPVRMLFKWLTRRNLLLYNPAADLDLPRGEHRLPKHVLTPAEAELLLNQPDIETLFGLRDRAILETLYSTGVRRMELANLKLHDLDLDRCTLMVRQGKGKKDRMIPIGRRAVAWVSKYLDEARPELLVPPDDGALFLSRFGSGFTPAWVSALVRRYVDATGLGKKGSAHMFRHTMATLMLENGADIRFIQQMLGHSSITATEIYTQVSIKALQEVHERTHPAAGLERRVRAVDAQGQLLDDEATLQATLEAEAREEQAEDP